MDAGIVDVRPSASTPDASASADGGAADGGCHVAPGHASMTPAFLALALVLRKRMRRRAK